MQFPSRPSFQLRHHLSQQVPGHLVEAPEITVITIPLLFLGCLSLGCCNLVSSTHPCAASSVQGTYGHIPSLHLFSTPPLDLQQGDHSSAQQAPSSAAVRPPCTLPTSDHPLPSQPAVLLQAQDNSLAHVEFGADFWPKSPRHRILFSSSPLPVGSAQPISQ